MAPADRVLLVQAALALVVMRLGLRLLSFRAIRRLVRRRRVARVTAAEVHARETARRVGWAVTLASRYVPGATCLPQALAGELLLRRAGIAGELRIGVAKRNDGRLRAHAWVESGGAVVIGGGRGEFTLLTRRRLPSAPAA